MAGGSSKRRSMADYSVATHAAGVREGDRRLERYHQHVGRARTDRAVWPGAAFIVEALLLLVFLTGSLAVLMSLNADAENSGRESAQLMDALIMASNSAEQFAADPQAVVGAQSMAADETDTNVVYRDNLLLVREVATEPTAAGTLFHATINVWDQQDVVSIETPDAEKAVYELTLVDRTVEPVYTLETSAYVSGVFDIRDDRLPLADVKGVGGDDGEVA